MGFLNAEIIIKQLRKYVEENREAFEILALEKTNFMEAICSINEARLSYNHVSKEVRIKSPYEFRSVLKDNLEWSMYTVLLFLSVEEHEMIRKVILLDENSAEIAPIKDDTENILDGYFISLWKTGINRLCEEYSAETYSDSDKKFFKSVGLRCNSLEGSIGDFELVQRAYSRIAVSELDAALYKGYSCIPKRIIEFLEQYTF